MQAIGNTPLIKLNKIVPDDSADVYVKYEGANPTGSMKDRMALAMIEGAEKRGQLKPGSRVVEMTGGSTGSALAMVCAVKGYQAHFVSSDAFSYEKLQTMRVFGAELDVIQSEGGSVTASLFPKMRARINELANEPDTFWTDQFNNPDNRTAYHALAKEIVGVLGNQIDEFIMAVGTGGAFSGTAEQLKAQVPSIRCIALEPYYVRALSGGDTTGKHKIEGTGTGFVTSITRVDLIDEIIQVKDEDAMATARSLAKEEGIFSGTSSGANVWAALQRAKALGKGKRVVTIICDSGLKYLNGELYK